MNLLIHNRRLFIIKKLIIYVGLLLFVASCRSDSPFSSYQQGEITLDNGKIIQTFLAITDQQQVKGLSGIGEKLFAKDQAILFTANHDKTRQFWMPDTHFDLDIFFLTKDFYVLEVDRKVPHFPFKGPREKVPLTRSIYCRHVLEMRADSPLAKKIKAGMMLNWKGKLDL